MARYHIIFMCACFLIGCGSRSALTIADEEAGSSRPRDHGVLPARDFSVSYLDTSPGRDWPISDNWFLTDSPISCLPIPILEVEGFYRGNWEGTFSCSNMPEMTVSGEVELKVKQMPMGVPTSFEVYGKLSGNISTFASISSTVEGTLNCTDLTADMPKMSVSLSGMQYTLKGSLAGQLINHSFGDGTWEAQGSDFGFVCQGKGTWSAWK